LWTDGFGSPLLTIAQEGAGRRARFFSRFHPEWNELPRSSALAAALQPLLLASHLPLQNEPRDQRRADPSQGPPAHGAAPQGAGETVLPPTAEIVDLHTALWIACIVLFAAERALSHRATAARRAEPIRSPCGRNGCSPDRSNMTRDQLDQLAREWRMRIAMREVLVVGAIVCAVAAFGAVWVRPALLVAGAAAAFGIMLASRLARVRPWEFDAAHVARHLDRAFPQFEESSALWLRPAESLTLIERLQRARVDEAARGLSAASSPSFAAPPRELLRAPALYLGIALALLLAVLGWRVMT
jgi:hypothetical protein